MLHQRGSDVQERAHFNEVHACATLSYVWPTKLWNARVHFESLQDRRSFLQARACLLDLELERLICKQLRAPLLQQVNIVAFCTNSGRIRILESLSGSQRPAMLGTMRGACFKGRQRQGQGTSETPGGSDFRFGNSFSSSCLPQVVNAGHFATRCTA